VQILDGWGMKYIGQNWFLIAGLLAGGTSLLFAQSYRPSALLSNANPLPTSSTDNSVLTIHKSVTEVNLLVTATDKHGKFVRNLQENDFKILDDHKPPEAIINFHRDTDLPLDLGLLIDTSGSVKSRFDFEQTAAITFLNDTVRPGFDKAFVAGFSRKLDVTTDFTDDKDSLAAGVRRLQDGGGTALYDAIYRACRDKLLKEKSGRPVRRALVIVSDGEDNQSEYSEAQAIGMAERAQVIIYTISTDDSGLILRGDYVLDQLAEATGGRSFQPYKMKDMKSAFAAIADELRSQYVISYRPADFSADGRYRTIQLISLKKDMQLRARMGYYAPQP
jgi:VWFA-related protein